MRQKIADETSGFGTTLRVVSAIILIGIIGLVVILLLRPERSIAAYCKVYKAENAQLADSKGDTYSVAIFSHRSSNPSDFAAAFKNLEAVAPSDIEPDIRTLKAIFEKIDKDPSQGLSASLSGLSAESKVKTWTEAHCNM